MSSNKDEKILDQVYGVMRVIHEKDLKDGYGDPSLMYGYLTSRPVAVRMPAS